jgi:hypothetical protein
MLNYSLIEFFILFSLLIHPSLAKDYTLSLLARCGNIELLIMNTPSVNDLAKREGPFFVINSEAIG